MRQSRSISPNRRPPWRERPSVGWRVRICTGPRERMCILPGDHVVELLVVDHADEDLRLEPAAGDPVVERLAARGVEAERLERLAERLLALAGEGGPVDRRGPRARRPCPPSISSTWATVIREGIACGLIRRSGVTPSRVNGMFSWGTMRPMTPFWPWREANLSPSSGTRWLRTLTLTSFEMFSPSVRMTLSTHPDSPEPDGHRRLPSLLGGEQVGLLLEEPRRAGLADEHVALADLELGEDEAVLAQVPVGGVDARAGDVGPRDLELVLLAAGILAFLARGRFGRTRSVRGRGRSRPWRRRARPACCTPRRRGRRRRSSGRPAAR